VLRACLSIVLTGRADSARDREVSAAVMAPLAPSQRDRRAARSRQSSAEHIPGERLEVPLHARPDCPPQELSASRRTPQGRAAPVVRCRVHGAERQSRIEEEMRSLVRSSS
jgi:hypothetical protein